MPNVIIGPRNSYTMYIDDSDMSVVLQHNWYLASSRTTPRVVSTVGRIVLTHLLLSPPPDMVVDHIDGNQLNNSRANLRVCTRGNNSKNRRGASNVRRRGNRWQARITHNYQLITVGMYDSEEEARNAANDMKRKLQGEYAPC